MSERSMVSIVMPVHNAEKHLAAALRSIHASTYPLFELIVVDDASTDQSVQIAESHGSLVLRRRSQAGPAAARNEGAAKARGDILLFLDSDIVVKPDTIEKVVGVMQDSQVAAVFGSYDDNPAEVDFLSQYRNLFHHFVHQNASSEAVTFWAGCGAIRRDIFLALGGFDAKKYSEPAVEDIELGYRVHRQGHRIRLDKSIQVKHLKKWTFYSILRTDIFCRALPWARLMLEQREITRDLNLKSSDRLSAGVVALVTAASPLLALEFRLAYLQALLLVILLLLNHPLYRFFLTKRGVTFAALSLPMHYLYYLYSGLSFTFCWMTQPLVRRRASSLTG